MRAAYVDNSAVPGCEGHASRAIDHGSIEDPSESGAPAVYAMDVSAARCARKITGRYKASLGRRGIDFNAKNALPTLPVVPCVTTPAKAVLTRTDRADCEPVDRLVLVSDKDPHVEAR